MTLEKPRGTYRIAVVGTSNETGIWLDHGGSYVSMLEALLRGRLPEHRKVEVLSFSIDGRERSKENAEIVRRRVVRFKPDLVLFRTSVPFTGGAARRSVYRGYGLIYPSDIPGALEDARRQVDYIESHRALITAYDISYCVRAAAVWFAYRSHSWRGVYLRAFIERRFQGPTMPRPWSLKRSVDIILEIRDLVARSQGQLILYDDESNWLLRDIARLHGIPFMSFRAPSNPSMRHEHDGHWNAAGHRFVARQIAERLIPLISEVRTAQARSAER